MILTFTIGNCKNMPLHWIFLCCDLHNNDFSTIRDVCQICCWLD